MNEALAVQAETALQQESSLNPSSFEQVRKVAQLLQKSSLVPKALKGDEAGTMLVITQSIQLGIPWTVGIKELYVVDSKVNPSARLLRSMVERHPSCELFDVEEATETSCTVAIKKSNWSEPKYLSYTLEDAKKAGLTGRNPNYQTRPREMLIARASGLAAQTYFPSVCLGLDLDDDYTGEAPAKVVTVTPKEDPLALAVKVHDAKKAPPEPADAPLEAEVVESEPEVSQEDMDAAERLAADLLGLEGGVFIDKWLEEHGIDLLEHVSQEQYGQLMADIKIAGYKPEEEKPRRGRRV